MSAWIRGRQGRLSCNYWEKTAPHQVAQSRAIEQSRSRAKTESHSQSSGQWQAAHRGMQLEKTQSPPDNCRSTRLTHVTHRNTADQPGACSRAARSPRTHSHTLTGRGKCTEARGTDHATPTAATLAPADRERKGKEDRCNHYARFTW